MIKHGPFPSPFTLEAGFTFPNSRFFQNTRCPSLVRSIEKSGWWVSKCFQCYPSFQRLVFLLILQVNSILGRIPTGQIPNSFIYRRSAVLFTASQNCRSAFSVSRSGLFLYICMKRKQSCCDSPISIEENHNPAISFITQRRDVFFRICARCKSISDTLKSQGSTCAIPFGISIRK